MKRVSELLNRHLNQDKSFITCTLYELNLKSGVSHYYTDRDVPFTNQGKQYRADGPIFESIQTQTNSRVSVDKLTIKVYSGPQDKVGGATFMEVAHNGGLDGAVLTVRRAFFDEDGTLIDVLDRFKGDVEVRSGGGLYVQIDVKSVAQRLNTDWPRRRYYPQCPYCLYSEECGVDVRKYRKRVRVESVPAYNQVRFNTTFDNGYYDAGGIEWLSGPLVGQTTQVMKSNGGVLTFITSSDTRPEVGNEAFIYPGCDKTPQTCRAKFNNFSRNRATPYVPLKETIRCPVKTSLTPP